MDVVKEIENISIYKDYAFYQNELHLKSIFII